MSKLEHELLNQKKEKPTNASLLFPEIQKELEAHKELSGSLAGLFIIQVLVNGTRVEEWYL